MNATLAIDVADRARRGLLRALGPVARTVVVPRERRVALVGTMGVVVALGLTWLAPLAVLALGPLLFGVPHLVADARYLVVRPGLHRQRMVLVGAALLVLGLGCGLGVRAGLGAAAFVALAAGGTRLRRGLVAAVFFVLAAIAWTAPFAADVVFFHAHNLVALALWLAWRRRTGRTHWLVLAALGLSLAALALGPLPAVVATHWSGLTFAELGETLSLSNDAARTQRLVLLFAFAQSVHYLVWLRLIPEDDRPGETPRSFAQSLRALRSDLGPLVLVLTAAVGVGLVVVALVRIGLARNAYLGIAYAHGHLELLAIGWLAAAGRRPRWT